MKNPIVKVVYDADEFYPIIFYRRYTKREYYEPSGSSIARLTHIARRLATASNIEIIPYSYGWDILFNW